MTVSHTLPHDAKQLCEQLQAPPRLVAHLTLVHDAAYEIVEGLMERFPKLEIDADAVLFGSATHDLGKILHPTELSGPGHRHEADGPRLLEENGILPHLARFSRTHGAWSREELQLEDLLVALADTTWKGQRLEDLESLVIDQIAEQLTIEKWEVFTELDNLLEVVGSQGDERLALQMKY